MHYYLRMYISQNIFQFQKYIFEYAVRNIFLIENFVISPPYGGAGLKTLGWRMQQPFFTGLKPNGLEKPFLHRPSGSERT